MRYLLTQHMESGHGILLAGPTGCGKTKVLRDLIVNTGKLGI